MVDRLLQSLGTKSKYYLFLLILTSLLCKIRVSPNPNSFFFSFLNALFIALLLMNYLDQLLLLTSDEFEPKFPELGRLRTELGHLNFRAETELTF